MFNRYCELLLKWQKVINLVSDTTLEELAERHFLDSAQLIKFIPNKQIKLADMGSGAGFPGLVLAMMGVAEVHLIESDIRKATFLREVSRETLGGNKEPQRVFIHDDRVEDTVIEGLDIITARALSPLRDLLVMTNKLAGDNGNFTALFLKGEKADEEIAQAKKRWNFDVEAHQSITDSTGKVLKINNLKAK